MTTRSLTFRHSLPFNLLSHCYYTTAGLNTPEDTGTSESPRGDEEQNTIVHGPSPGPGKHGSKDDVTRKSSRVHCLCGVVSIHFYPSLSE